MCHCWLSGTLKAWLDFLLFCEFDGNAKLPDASTLNRFNGKLEHGDVKAIMFEEVDRQLAAQAITLLPVSGALLDVAVK